jgi:hypothetical protein
MVGLAGGGVGGFEEYKVIVHSIKRKKVKKCPLSNRKCEIAQRAQGGA